MRTATLLLDDGRASVAFTLDYFVRCQFVESMEVSTYLALTRTTHPINKLLLLEATAMYEELMWMKLKLDISEIDVCR